MNSTTPGFFASLILPAFTLWQREVTRFLRQRNRAIGALGTPLVFWFVIGSGMGTSVAVPGATQGFTYMQYFFPGTLLLIILFTAIFSTISIIEDRREGFLQSVLAAPVSRSAIVLGKLLGGATLSLIQGLLFLAVAPLAGVPIAWSAVLPLAAIMFLVGFGLTGLGYLLAWPLDSTAGFHALMNLVLMPLWLLSGALFPPDGAWSWVKAFILVNPLHYGLAALSHLLFGDAVTPPAAQPDFIFSLNILALFAVVVVALCSWLTTRVRGKNP
jgi:ABC-2 type transport system permease protein